MLWGKYVSPTIRRYITLTVASICMATAGSLFTFSVLASSFTSNLGYTGWDLNIISGVGNTALYVVCMGIFERPSFILFYCCCVVVVLLRERWRSCFGGVIWWWYGVLNGVGFFLGGVDISRDWTNV